MNCKSSFHGKIPEIPGISADNFEKSAELPPRAYFLSHCHSDHTKGLYSEDIIKTLEQTNAKIYMSEPTAAIINDEQRDGRLMKYIVPLKLGSEMITLPSAPERGLGELCVSVTLIPAGHSFGSVMFLFQTTVKTVLFTGDFRISKNDVSKYRHFHDSDGNPIKLDAMYVDTTFLKCHYANFPKRSASVECAVAEIKKWLARGEEHRVALHTSAKYGYENVFNEIYKNLGVKVYVKDDRWRFYSTVSHLVPGVTNEENSTKIHICRSRSQTSHHFCVPDDEDDGSFKYLYLHFSAWKWNNYETDDEVVNRNSDHQLDVCFATHCSRSEVIYFVNYFPCKKVEGFPFEYSCNSPKKKSGIDFAVSPQKRKLGSPRSEEKKKVYRKVDSRLLRKIFDFS